MGNIGRIEFVVVGNLMEIHSCNCKDSCKIDTELEDEIVADFESGVWGSPLLGP